MPKSNSITKTKLKAQIQDALNEGDIDKASKLSNIYQSLYNTEKTDKQSKSKNKDDAELDDFSENQATQTEQRSVKISVPTASSDGSIIKNSSTRKVTFISSGKSSKEEKLCSKLINFRDNMPARDNAYNTTLGTCPMCKTSVGHKNVVKTVFDGNIKECQCPNRKCRHKFRI
jgi:hypothetical protein